MEKWKKEYDRIAAPEKGKEKMEEAVMRAKEKKERIRRKRRIRSMTGASSALSIIQGTFMWVRMTFHIQI